LSWQASSQAALTMSTTRVIYDGERRSVSLVVANPSKDTFAVQAWVNTAQDDTVSVVPFAITPSLFRLDPTRQQQVQLSGLPNDLPADRESLFYFNVQEIPQAAEHQSNVLAIALRTRIKLFYRPPALKGNPVASLNQLKWSTATVGSSRRLVVDNPTPYHVTFSRLTLHAGAQSHAVSVANMAAPFSRQHYDLPTAGLQGPLRVEFTTINDYGGATAPLRAAVSAGN
jgi:P pilus assembly chaperone PapD